MMVRPSRGLGTYVCVYISTARSYIVISMFKDLIDRLGMSREAVWSFDDLLTGKKQLCPTRTLKSVSSF